MKDHLISYKMLAFNNLLEIFIYFLIKFIIKFHLKREYYYFIIIYKRLKNLKK